MLKQRIEKHTLNSVLEIFVEKKVPLFIIEYFFLLKDWKFPSIVQQWSHVYIFTPNINDDSAAHCPAWKNKLMLLFKHLFEPDQQAPGAQARCELKSNQYVVYWNTFGWSLDMHLCKRALLSMFISQTEMGLQL